MLKTIWAACGIVALAFSGSEAAEYDADWVTKMREGAESGIPACQYALGKCYDLGNCEGIPLDYEKAGKWYEKAAVQGFAKAQLELGNQYLFGIGRPYDVPAGLAWVDKAVAQGERFLVLHGNPYSKIVHGSSCKRYLSKAAKESFPSVEKAMRKGYTLCPICQGK